MNIEAQKVYSFRSQSLVLCKLSTLFLTIEGGTWLMKSLCGSASQSSLFQKSYLEGKGKLQVPGLYSIHMWELGWARNRHFPSIPRNWQVRGLDSHFENDHPRMTLFTHRWWGCRALNRGGHEIVVLNDEKSHIVAIWDMLIISAWAAHADVIWGKKDFSKMAGDFLKRDLKKAWSSVVKE